MDFPLPEGNHDVFSQNPGGFTHHHPDPPAGRESLQVMRNVGAFSERKNDVLAKKKRIIWSEHG